MPDIENHNKQGVKMPLVGVLYASLSALLFGLTTPVSKVLLDVGPILLAGLLYAGSGLGLLIWELSRLMGGKAEPLKVSGKDLLWLFLVIIFGGVFAPVLLLNGLKALPASSASLFLNLEGVFTALIAWCIFREAVDRRLVLGMVAIVAAGLVLSVNFTSGQFVFSQGALFIAAACLCWALDNNFTGRIETLNATRIALTKGLAAGACNITIAYFTVQTAQTAQTVHSALPAPMTLAAALAAGFFGYGLSLTLFIMAQRSLGTARTSAYFAAAPFVGAAVSIIAFHEALTWQLGAATLLMAFGLYLHLSEEHSHEHSHEEVEHEHEHEHDDKAPDPHHQHEHEDGRRFTGKHSHKHRHPAVIHQHPHYPDMHHRHEH